MKIFLSLFLSLWLMGCATTETHVVFEDKYIPVTVSEEFYNHDPAPVPLTVEDFKGKTPKEIYALFGGKITELYNHIGHLMDVIYSIEDASAIIEADVRNMNKEEPK